MKRRAIILWIATATVVMTIGASCTHFSGQADRGPAGVSACHKLSKEELSTMQSLVKADKGITESFNYLADIANAMKLDQKKYGRARMNTRVLITPDKDEFKDSSDFPAMEEFAWKLLTECKKARTKKDLEFVKKKTTPNMWAIIRSRCGPPDVAFPQDPKYVLDTKLRIHAPEFNQDNIDVTARDWEPPVDDGTSVPLSQEEWWFLKRPAPAEMEHDCTADPANISKCIQDFVRVDSEIARRKAIDKLSLRVPFAILNQMLDPRTGEVAAPEVVSDVCANFKARSNIEDAVEHFLVCSDAYALNLQEYDSAKSQYVFETDERGNPKKKIKEFSKTLKKCLATRLDNKIEVDQSGPMPRQNTPPTTSVQASGGATSAADDFSGRPRRDPPTLAERILNEGKVVPHTEDMRSSPLLPGDRKAGLDEGKRSFFYEDKCVDDFAYYAKRNKVPLSADLTGEKLLDSFKNERLSFSYAVSRQQLYSLAQAYLTAARQRHWEGPHHFNQNIQELVMGCSNKRLRQDLVELLREEMLIEGPNGKPDPYNDRPALTTQITSLLFGSSAPAKKVDTDFDPSDVTDFLEQREEAENRGSRMVDAARRIANLRTLVTLLNVELGSKEVDVKELPDWFGHLPVPLIGLIPIPFFHQFAGAPVQLTLKNYTDYQCNLFSTSLSFDDTVVGTSKNLIRESDKIIRETLANDSFRKATFCKLGKSCSVPSDFLAYLQQINPKMFKDADMTEMQMNDGIPYTLKALDKFNNEQMRYQVMQQFPRRSLTQWCSMRFKAARALQALEQDLVMQYPALSHAEVGADGKVGKPLFEHLKGVGSLDAILAQMKTSNWQSEDASKDVQAKHADAVAERVLPKMQDSVKRYVKKICADYESAEMPSTYMALLNGDFMNGFNYCAALPPGEQERLGISCGDREDFISCKMKHEAKDWMISNSMPKFIFDVAMTGMDALFMWSVMSGGLKFATTAKGALSGGAAGAGFAVASYGVTQAIGEVNGQSHWDTYTKAAGAAAVEGVESQVNALTAIAEGSPHFSIGEFVQAFVIGAALSGHAGPKSKARVMPEFYKIPDGGSVGVPKAVFEEFGTRFKEAAREKTGGGFEFDPAKINGLKKWMVEKTGEHPDFLNGVARNFADGLFRMSDADYGYLFDKTAGKTPLARVKRAMVARVKRATEKMGEGISEAKNAAASKIFRGYKPKPTEVISFEVGIQPADFTTLVQKLPPREAAIFAEAAEQAVVKIKGEDLPSRATRIAQFLRKTKAYQIVCPSGVCLGEFRARFGKLEAPLAKLAEQIDALLHKKGRAQFKTIEAEWAKIEADFQKSGLSKKEYQAKISDDIFIFSRTALESKFAYWAWCSDAFRSELAHYLKHRGALSYRLRSRYLAHFVENNLWKLDARRGRFAKIGGIDIPFLQRIYMPDRVPLTDASLAKFFMEVDRLIWESNHPQKSFASLWYRGVMEPFHQFLFGPRKGINQVPKNIRDIYYDQVTLPGGQVVLEPRGIKFFRDVMERIHTLDDVRRRSRGMHVESVELQAFGKPVLTQAEFNEIINKGFARGLYELFVKDGLGYRERVDAAALIVQTFIQPLFTAFSILITYESVHLIYNYVQGEEFEDEQKNNQLSQKVEAYKKVGDKEIWDEQDRVNREYIDRETETLRTLEAEKRDVDAILGAGSEAGYSEQDKKNFLAEHDEQIARLKRGIADRQSVLKGTQEKAQKETEEVHPE